MSTGTLNGIAITRAAITIPRWGAWVADVETVLDTEQSGAAVIVVGGLELRGTIVRGGIDEERGRYRVVAGAAGWRSIVPARSYRNAAGVRLATILGDAAGEVGETWGTLPDTRIGGAYVRQLAEASRVLDDLGPEGWHVDELGVTQWGLRAAAEYALPYAVMQDHRARGLLTVAAEDLRGLVPGAVLEGRQVASVRHELGETLRSHLHMLETSDQTLGAFRRLVEWVIASLGYLGSYEYQIRAVSGGYVDVSPVRSASGLPQLANVPVRVGIPGGAGEPAVGSSCVVRFLDGDPTRPYVSDLEGESGGSWLPVSTTLTAADATELGGSEPVNPVTAPGRFLRWGDTVQGPVAFGQPLTLVPPASPVGTMSKARSAS